VRIFITYAREDGTTVAQLGADLEGSERQVWIDRDLTGGQTWWEEILEQIRACDLYVFALSASSLDSRPCLRELEYAQALGRPLLPIKVGEVSIQQAPRVIADAQVVDYVGRTPDGVLALRDALDHAPPAPGLPDPLPEPPAVPISYFGHYREQIGADSLPFTEQQALLIDLKSHLGNEEDRDDALDLLASLRRRHDLAQGVVSEIDLVLKSLEEPSTASTLEPPTSPIVPPTPPRPHRLRWLVAGVGLTVGLSFLVTMTGATADPPTGSTSTVSDTTLPDTTGSDTTIPDTTVPDTTIPVTTIPETTIAESFGCPLLIEGFYLPSPDTQYGPFGDGHWLAWHQAGGFSTIDPSGLSTPYPDPGFQMIRDTWQPLVGSPFQVCVDTAGNVYGVYAP
jgi:hypothetical protein